jgi:hypothetical protein
LSLPQEIVNGGRIAKGYEMKVGDGNTCEGTRRAPVDQVRELLRIRTIAHACAHHKAKKMAPRKRGHLLAILPASMKLACRIPS